MIFLFDSFRFSPVDAFHSKSLRCPRFSFCYIIDKPKQKWKKERFRPIRLFSLLRFNRYVLSKAEEKRYQRKGRRKGKESAKLKHLYGNFFIQMGICSFSFVSLRWKFLSRRSNLLILPFSLAFPYSAKFSPVCMGLVLTTLNVFRS